MHALAILLVLLVAPARAASAQDPKTTDEAPVETHSFSLPDTRLVRAVYERAEGHVAARRWREALADYQRILEDHAGDLLAGERPRNASGHTSDQAVHPGAARRVRERLFELPEEARRLYVDRHGRDAQAALDAARARGDAGAVVALARRWPLTPAAVSAWWSLGDLEHAAGRPGDGTRSWARAIAYELGDPRATPRDVAGWNAALERLAARGPVPAGVERRAAVARAWLASDGRDENALARELRLPGDGERAGPVPGPEDDAWPAPFRLPWHPLQAASRGDNVFVVKSGDRLFATTGLRVLALGAFEGSLVWDSGEPEGWNAVPDVERDERFKGVDTEALLLAPAATPDVVVAALQVPYVRLRFEQFQRIDITRPIPERRLHAYDAHTGELLWSHAPPPKWDGESGEIATRLSCAGPPVVAGSKVVVPLVRMQGRIDLHVAAFDLHDGSLVWSTAVISGQRELNMFGRPEHEFAAPPVRVEGDRVVVLTQLGSIAALDLASGEILWQTLYDQIPTPPTQDFRAPSRPTPWRNAPPVVADGVVVATPFDGESLVGVDLETGALAFEWRSERLHAMARLPYGSIDQILGASGRTVWLGGDRIVALEFAGGLAASDRPRVRWVWPVDEEPRYRAGRPALVGDRVVVPFDSERVELAAEDGRVLERIAWPGGDGGGNVLCVPGEIYTADTREIRGVFEWTALLTRARTRLAANARDVDAALALARLLAGRAAADWARGQGEPARARYAEARGVLEGVVRESGRSDPSIALELVAVLRGEARVRAQLADPDGALELLAAARIHATHASVVRNVLLDRAAILRARGPAGRAALLETLADLDASSADEPVVVDVADVRAGADLALRVTLDAFARPEEAPDSAFVVPCGLLVRFERAAALAADGDTPAEFVVLHEVLGRYAAVAVAGVTAGDLATERILALLAAGRDAGYAPFEERARASLDAARAARDGEALARVARDHPGSRAAREANDALLSLALEQGDVAAVARIVAAELPSEVPFEVLDDRAARLLVHLAETARRAGNAPLAAGLVASLAAERPDFVPGAPAFDGRSLLERSGAEPRFESWSGTSETARFEGDFREHDVVPGDFEVLGIAVPEAAVGSAPPAARGMVVLESRSTREGRAGVLALLGSDAPLEARWTAEIEPESMPCVAGASGWSRRAAFSPGRLVLALRDELRAYDTRTGSVAWTAAPEGDFDGLTVGSASGVVVATAIAGRERPRLEAHDATDGALLWRVTVAESGANRSILVGDRHVVLLPASGHTRGSVRDLFTGRLVSRFELPTPAVGSADAEAWLDRGLVIVPWFDEMRFQERNHVVAFDLVRGSLAWRLPFDLSEKRMLTGVIQQGERTILRIGALPRDEDPLPPPRLAELSVDLGAASPLDAARLGPEDVVLGLPRDTRVRLPDGPLFVLSPRAARDGTPREARLRAIDPARGELWVQGLGLSFDDLRSSGTPQAAVSDTTVVVALPLYDGRQRPPDLRTILTVYDRATGAIRETRKIQRNDKRDEAQLHAFGDVLLVRRPKQLEILR